MIYFCIVRRSYYESNDLPAALGVIEEALTRHPDLVSDDVVNMAAELYISSHKYNKAIEVHVTTDDYKLITISSS